VANTIDFDKNIIDFKGLKIKLASPEEILSWSHGEVTKPETINYRTWRPEKNGLFCEKIFGPTRDYECYCGKYRKIRFKGIVCEKCGVEVTTSKVRRERMGHISLAVPVVHVWFLKNTPFPLTMVLGVPQRELEAVIYFARYLVVDINKEKVSESLENLKKGIKEKLVALRKEGKERIAQLKEEEKQEKEKLAGRIKNKDQLHIAQQEVAVRFRQQKKRVEGEILLERESLKNLYRLLRQRIKSLRPKDTLSEEEMFHLRDFNADGFVKAKMGAEAVLEVLEKTDLAKLVKELKRKIKATSSLQKKKQLLKRMRIINGMLQAGVNPAWMILTVLPVIPPELRPMVQLTGGRFATSDLNDLYRRVINRNNRLKRLISLGAPDIILRNEKRMLQEAVDMLIDVTKARRRASMRRPPRSLSDLLRGKKGRFRKNLLGKRVDYSGRSVITVGPELKLDECGLPREIALEIFRPFILRELILRGLAPNIKSAKSLLDHRIAEVYEILEDVVKDKRVLLNRAPTLHKLSILAFKPVLIDGLAIRLHPCVCKGYNADFDGDQMGVFLPLSARAQKEAKKLMRSSINLLKPADGEPVTVPSKEMVVGCFFATSIREEDLPLEEEAKKDIKKVLEKVKIFATPDEALHAYELGVVKLRQLVGVKIEKEWVVTTPGRILFNSFLPPQFGFINQPVNSKTIKKILIDAFQLCSRKEVVALIDAFKDFGFWGMTQSGISLAIFDCGEHEEKEKIIREAQQRVAEIEENYRAGLITAEEKDQMSKNVWMETTDEIAALIWNSFSPDSPIKLINNAGVKRVSLDQIKQVSGMRGLVVDPLGNIVPLPTKSSFREGLDVFEYVTGARGSRKGLTDTALKTADAGYLTRRLVDVAHSCLVREEDCGTKEGIVISRHDERGEFFQFRILGRVLAADVVHPRTKKVLIKAGEVLDEEKIALIEKAKVEEVTIRSPLKCRTKYGVCARCYGWDLSTREMVAVGTPVGVIAAQSIGEPGTQLTLRTKHSGGVIGLDVTQGLPRVQELLEVRRPKRVVPMAEIDGRVKVKKTSEGYQITIKGKEGKVEQLVPLSATLRVKDGDLVAKGTPLASGSLDIREILRLKGMEAAQRYLLDEVQKVYESQRIGIHDKHFEVIIREMSSRVRITSVGDTNFLLGSYVEEPVFVRENERVKKEGGKPARGRRDILGLVQAALNTDSWLSAASFQETTNVLTESCLLGKEDRLIGLKENVIIGRLIPVTKKRVKVS